MRAEVVSNVFARNVEILAGEAPLQGDLTRPTDAKGLVVFAHGSGSSRFSPRNQHVARALNERGFATLLLDLLTPDEEAVDERTGRLRFDIGLLATRLGGATDWALTSETTRDLGIGYFGASTGAAAAIIAATERASAVKAVVSRGGRVDLAGKDSLESLLAPTLLIVGEHDPFVLAANRDALRVLRGTTSALSIVKGASHLFEEPGALDRVAHLAGEWFEQHLAAAAQAGRRTV